MKFLLSLCLSFVCFYAKALAQTPILPPGYSVQLSASGDPSFIRYDFDGDGRIDVFCAAIKAGQDDAMLFASLKHGNMTRVSGLLSMCCGIISQKAGIVQVQSKGMRGFAYYKFRWDKVKKDFRLIGYDTESFGSATGDGSGKSSLNLLNGAYSGSFCAWNDHKKTLDSLPRINIMVPISRRIYLRDFGEDEDTWLTEVSASRMPHKTR